MQCTACGTPGDGKFCGQCGAPLPAADEARLPAEEARFWQEDPPAAAWAPPHQPAQPQSSPTRWILGAGAAALVLVAAGVAIWYATAPPDRVEADPGSTPPAASTTSTGEGSTSSGSSTTSPDQTSSSSPSSTTADVPPRQALVDLRRDSLDDIERDGRWAVTLSAKYDGITDDQQTTRTGSHTFRLKDIQDLHETLSKRHASDGETYLITSSDLESTAEGSYPDTLWMTMLDPGRLSSRDAALRWCESAFPELEGDELLNACYPRQLKSP